jgi:DNA-binding transcriptional regulator YdaS (Cro superfamily)
MEKLISYFGSHLKTAQAIGVTRNFITMVVNGKRRLSFHKVLLIEEITNGAITRHDLRPDIYPVEKLKEDNDKSECN